MVLFASPSPPPQSNSSLSLLSFLCTALLLSSLNCFALSLISSLLRFFFANIFTLISLSPLHLAKSMGGCCGGGESWGCGGGGGSGISQESVLFGCGRNWKGKKKEWKYVHIESLRRYATLCNSIYLRMKENNSYSHRYLLNRRHRRRSPLPPPPPHQPPNGEDGEDEEAEDAKSGEAV